MLIDGSWATTKVCIAVLSLVLVIFCTAPNVLAGLSGYGGVPNQVVTGDYMWSQTSARFQALTAGVKAKVTLTPCPRGVDTSANPALGGPLGAYPVYISDGSNSESVYVLGGTCMSGASSGTIQFIPYLNHTNYSIQSATSGIQEAINSACGINDPLRALDGQCHIIIPPTGQATSALQIYDTIYFHAHRSILEGDGVYINCNGRGPCLQVGNLYNANYFTNNTISGVTFDEKNPIAPCRISHTQRTSGLNTITLASPCPQLRTGDRVTIMYTDNTVFEGDVPYITVVDSTHFTYPRAGGADIPAQSTPGLVGLTQVMVLDNAGGTTLRKLTNFGINGGFKNLLDFWDDESATVMDFTNGAVSPELDANWMGWAVYSGGARNLASTAQQLAPVINIIDSNLTNTPCFYDQNSNGLYVINTVCQNSIVEANVSNVSGNYQGAYFQNFYSESGLGSNPPGGSPWGGLGVAGLIGGATSGVATFEYHGNGAFSGAIPGSGSGSTTYIWSVVAHDVTTGAVTAPMPVMYDKPRTPGSIRVSWPRIANGADRITYDLIRSTSGIGIGAGCAGRNAKACGSVATSLAQCSGFVCSFADNETAPTSSYTVNTVTRFSPAFTFWPGQVVLGNTPIITDQEMSVTYAGFFAAPKQYARSCANGYPSNGPSPTVCLSSIPGTSPASPFQPAMLLGDGPSDGSGGSNPGIVQGRLNLYQLPTGANFYPKHVITLFDSQPGTTLATTGYRPLARADDVYLGFDTGGPNSWTNVGLSMGSPVSISQYIGNVGDNTSWKERLTTKAKVFNVPIVMQSVTFASLPSGPVNGERIYCSDCTVTSPGSCMNVTTAAACTCTSGGTGAEAKRINGAWLCN